MGRTIFVTTLILMLCRVAMAEEIKNYTLDISKVNQETSNLQVKCFTLAVRIVPKAKKCSLFIPKDSKIAASGISFHNQNSETLSIGKVNSNPFFPKSIITNRSYCNRQGLS